MEVKLLKLEGDPVYEQLAAFVVGHLDRVAVVNQIDYVLVVGDTHARRLVAGLERRCIGRSGAPEIDRRLAGALATQRVPGCQSGPVSRSLASFVAPAGGPVCGSSG